MIAYKGREVKRGRKSQTARNLERLYKEGKCRDCSVIVTRMDFAKILGKFTKVKIQYENVSSPKPKKVTIQVDSPPNDTSRLKTNENGMVMVRRNAYMKHPINNSQSIVSKKTKANESPLPRLNNNVLKENNALPKTKLKDKNSNYNTKPLSSNTKQYTIIFVDPKNNNNRDCASKTLLTDLVPKINKSILPSEEWCIDYLPKTEQTTEDKVYDRIEAELEGLMFSERQEDKLNPKPKIEESKVDDFPSIMDILNDNYSVSENKQNDQNVLIEFKSNLESSDVEAMLLGKPSNIVKISESTPMEVDSSVMSNLIDDVDKISAVASIDKNSSEQVVELSIKENPQSPSILDGNLEKGAEEHIPAIPMEPVPADCGAIETAEEGNKPPDSEQTPNITMEIKMDIDPINALSEVSTGMCNVDVTDIVFKKFADGKCIKTVTCPKNLKYSVELDGKPVEFLGAPKHISCIEDLQQRRKNQADKDVPRICKLPLRCLQCMTSIKANLLEQCTYDLVL